MKKIKISLILILTILLKNIAYADNIKTTACINYLDIDKKVTIFTTSKNTFKNNLKILTSPKNLQINEKNDFININIKGRPTIIFQNIKIEVHAGTLFINNKGIELKNGVTIFDEMVINGAVC